MPVDSHEGPSVSARRSPRVTVFAHDYAVAKAVARRIADLVKANPRVVLGLPTGRTPLVLYRELATLHAHGVDFSQVTTFNLDEFLGIPASHPGSYRCFMEQRLFSHVNVKPENRHFLDGNTTDPDAECVRYERAIADAGGIDLQVLGIGTNGHIGFNEPARALEGRTHRVTLKLETRRSNASLFGGDPANVPPEALSMGMATILHSRAIVLLATGRSKASCVERVVKGPLTTELPASFLQIAPAVGPEIIAGSTRLKAGTATKMVLNMLTTIAMIKLGKTYGNLMVDVQTGSEKLKDRAKRILVLVTGIDYEAAGALLKLAKWNVKAAIIMQRADLTLPQALRRLKKAHDSVREAIGEEDDAHLRELLEASQPPARPA